MAFLTLNGAEAHVCDSGGDGEPILFIHGLMLASESWDAQVAAFRPTHRVVVYDLRGQGRSARTRDRLDLDALAEDAAALIERLGLGPTHVVGFSMGAFIAMRLAARQPALLRSLTLIGPSADAEEPSNLPRYRLMIGFVRLFGPALLAGPLMRILFGPTWLADPATRAERTRWRGVLRRLPRALHRAAAASAARAPIHDLLAAIRTPTLIVSGEEDQPVPTALARRVHEGVAGSRFAALPATGHAAMIERPEAFNALLAGFLRDPPQASPVPERPPGRCVMP
jgi:pimeloyl-ACP methyl ester carboxylesterase